ncbi:MAG TPA: hypothetical protein VMN57_11325 [Anaerolineales bacterium]|nr:hypothetical protein [Anaerolineales bacterium]
MTTLTETLRPLGMGELLDRAIRLYRRNFFKFIGVIALMQVPFAVISLIVTLATSEAVLEAIPNLEEISPDENPLEAFGSDYYVGIAANLVVVVAELILVGGVASAALARIVADSYLGEELSTLNAYRAVGNRWAVLVRAILLFLGANILLFGWTIVPCAGWLTGPGMLIVLAAMVFPLVAPVVVMEDFGARKSIRRAWELVRGRFWWIFGFSLMLFLFNWVVVSGPLLVANYGISLLLPESLFENPETYDNLTLAIQALITLFFELLYLPLQLTCLTLLYFDLRVRTEGLDLVLHTRTGEAHDAVPVRDLVAGTSKLPDRAVFTGREIGNFAMLTLLLIGVYIIFLIGIVGVMGVFFPGALG